MSDTILQRIAQLFQRQTAHEEQTKKQFAQVGNTFKQVEEAVGGQFNETNGKISTLTVKVGANTELLASYGEMIEALQQAATINKNKIGSVEASVINVVGGLNKNLNAKLDSISKDARQAIVDTELRLRDTSRNLILNLAKASQAKLEQSSREYIKGLVDAIPPAEPGKDAYQWEFKFSEKKRSVLMFRREDWNYWEYRDLSPKIDYNQILKFIPSGGGVGVGGPGGANSGGGDPGSGSQLNLNLVVREDGDVRQSQVDTINFTGDGVTVTQGLPGKVTVDMTIPTFPGNVFNRMMTAFGKTGRINRYGVYVEQKNINSDGTITFYPTSNGLSNGSLLFDEITDVEAVAFLPGSESAFNLPLVVGKTINGVSSVDLVVTKGKLSTTILASIIETVTFASDTDIVVNIRIGGRLSDFALGELDNQGLDEIIDRIEDLEAEVGPNSDSRIDDLEEASNDRLFVAGVGGVGEFKIVKINFDGTVNHADATVLGDAYITLGMTMNTALAGGDVQVRKAGEVQNPLWSWTTGEPVFLDLDGELTQTPPLSHEFHLPIGFAFSPVDIEIRIQSPVLIP